jgi:hypothetical protein
MNLRPIGFDCEFELWPPRDAEQKHDILKNTWKIAFSLKIP